VFFQKKSIQSNPVRFIDALELKKRIDRGDKLVLLDVREGFEIQECCLPSITHIPLGQIAYRFQELNPESEIVCICHLGQRSFNAAQYLVQNGFSNVYSLNGGMAAYIQKADPSLLRF
jgi:rhodanese-related sulfurtransferase